MGTQTNVIPKFHFLGNRSVLQSQLSDHNILINGQSLLLNMMMQGRWNKYKKRFNNGFRYIESNQDYQNRIHNIVYLLAEAVELNPQTMIIGLVEAPIKPCDINYFLNTAMKFKVLQPFFSGITLDRFTSMGIASFVNQDYVSVTEVQHRDADFPENLCGRIQTLDLILYDKQEKLRVYNLHLPYDIAKSNNSDALIQSLKNIFKENDDQAVLIMGDFNMSPAVIAYSLNAGYFYMQKNNNILIQSNADGKVVGASYDSVDGFIYSTELSAIRVQRPYLDTTATPNMDVSLAKENVLYRKVVFISPIAMLVLTVKWKMFLDRLDLGTKAALSYYVINWLRSLADSPTKDKKTKNIWAALFQPNTNSIMQRKCLLSIVP